MTYLAKPKFHHPALPKNKLGYTHRDIASLHEALGRMSKDAAVTS